MAEWTRVRQGWPGFARPCQAKRLSGIKVGLRCVPDQRLVGTVATSARPFQVSSHSGISIAALSALYGCLQPTCCHGGVMILQFERVLHPPSAQLAPGPPIPSPWLTGDHLKL